ncbi:hypothetical protein ACFV9C_42200 [Kribbella sp. NPDC059898]|uniref:hypothetical protein n=1 Tax=Kribbella sp. NPDC059898 TaxID=3346995 RepID=UPI00364B960B
MAEAAHLRVLKLRAELGIFHTAGELTYGADSDDPGSADEAMGQVHHLLGAAATALQGVVIKQADRTLLSDTILLQATEDLEDAVRMLGYDNRRTIAAPLAWDLLKQLVLASVAVGRLAGRIQADLPASLAEYDVFEDDEARDPTTSVSEAGRHLGRARDLAEQLAKEMQAAQKAINGQSHNGPKADIATQRPSL